MEFTSRLSVSMDPQRIAADLVQDDTSSYDLGFLFISNLSKTATAEVGALLKSKLNLKNLIGCTCAGIISTSSEIEYQPGTTLILGKFPDVKIKPFSLNQTAMNEIQSNEDWYKFFGIDPTEQPKFIVFPDPFMLDMDYFLQSINTAYKNSPVVGGLSSLASKAGGNTLILDDEHFTEGMVGVVLTGNVNIDTVVSQGCRPVGDTYIITKAQDNIIFELAGQPFYKVLEGVMLNGTDRDRELAQEAIFVGIAMNEYKDKFKRGDFLVRGVIGLDPENGAGAVAEYVQAGQTIQFHLRDAATATEDLNALLETEHKNLPKPKGALVFSCNGRGMNLFSEKNHDIDIIQKRVGPVPAAGFFCAGEIGPVGGSNFLHGFTNSIALFYDR